MAQFSVKIASVHCRRTEILFYHHHSLIVYVTLGESHQLSGVQIFPYDKLEEFKISFQVGTIYPNYGGCHAFGWFKGRKDSFA